MLPQNPKTPKNSCLDLLVDLMMYTSVRCRVTSDGNAFVVFLWHVNPEENQREYETQWTDHDVTNGEEVVLAAKQIGRRDHESFVAWEAVGIVIVIDLEVVSALIEVLVYYSVEFPEVRETGSAHPHYKVF